MLKPPLIADSGLCRDCQACTLACSLSHEGQCNPGLARLSISKDMARYEFTIVICQHCEDPECLAACPAGTITRDGDGWVQLDEAACTGCGACVAACPFGAIAQRADAIATKCDGCADEVARGWAPTCVRACPMRALHYDAGWDGPGQRCAGPTFEDGGVGPAVLYVQRPPEARPPSLAESS